MSFGKAVEHLAEAEHEIDKIDDAFVRHTMRSLVGAIREMGKEVERLFSPTEVPGTDYGKPPCTCYVRVSFDPAVEDVWGPSWIIATRADCPLHSQNLDALVDAVSESR